MINFSRAPLASPEFDSLPGPCVDALRTTSTELAQLRPLPPEVVSSAPDSHFAALSHRLSPAFEQLHAPMPANRRSRSECEALRQVSAGESGLDGADLPRFRSSLEQLNVLATTGAARWRTGWAGLEPDAAGHQVGFPPVGAVPRQLEAIRQIILDDCGRPALFDATRVLCLFVNGHPFTDGNGRVARMLFNLLLRRGGMPSEVYLPFYELAARSRGGYVIALRQAEIRGDWQPILLWVVAAIRCWRGLEQVR